MQKKIFLYSVILFAILTVSCKKERFQTESQTDYDKEILDTINAHRLSLNKGLTALEHNDFLWQVANEHTENMANGDVPFGNEGITERSNRIKLQLGNGVITENVATDNGTAGEVVESWLASRGYRINLEGDFTLTGLSAVQAGNGLWYYTQIFYKANP